MKALILGGARSGKSRYAENQLIKMADREAGSLIYVATATVGDEEMAQRIQHHKNQRDSRWQLVEEPLALADVMMQYHQPNHYVLVDCLTLWLSNSLAEGTWGERKSAFLKALTNTEATVVLVSNEVGQGIVPLGELSRQFIDESGWLHQALASLCDTATLVVAGLPVPLKEL